MNIYSAAQQQPDFEKSISHDHMGPTNSIQMMLVENGEGADPILGLSYRCDYAAEQESGTGGLSSSISRAAAPGSFVDSLRPYSSPSNLTSLVIRGGFVGDPASTTPQSDLVTDHGDVVSIRPLFGPYDLDSQLGRARRWIADHRGHIEGVPSRWEYDRKTMPQLLALAAERGIAGTFRRKDDLVAKIMTTDETAFPGRRAAWFQYGNLLVIPKTGGAFGAVLDGLVDAAAAGTLMTGSISAAAFASGLSLFDSRDLSDQTRSEITELTKWRKDRMAELVPVAKKLVERGYDWYFLGNPSVLSTDGGEKQLRYWLNGMSADPGNRFGGPQPFGWYTLDELAAEKFADDARARVAPAS